jgi:uncharacterized protein GlcG (DUF336 family)
MPLHDESLSLIVIATGGLPVPHGKTFIGTGATGSTGVQDEKVVEAAAVLRPRRRATDALSGIQD